MINKESLGRVLVIDDEEATRYIFRRILQRAGFEVEEARTGKEGLMRAMGGPDIIISDVNLPDMLGYDVSSRLKANPATCNIPVLQISASFLSEESKVQALEQGADSYLTLPVEPTVLIAQVNALLRLRQAEILSHVSALQWQTTFDALSDGLALADNHGKLVRANATFMQLLDLVSSDLEGRSLDEVVQSRFGIDLHALSLSTAKNIPMERNFANRWFRIRHDAIRNDPVNNSGSILIVTEITDQRKLQETLKLSERLAATGRLAHIIAHEINNPLEAMSNLLYLSSMATEGEDPAHAYIEQAFEELMRISRITKQVLAYHRESLEPVLTAADEVLDGVLAMFRAHLSNSGTKLVAELRCADKILVHPGEIRQVFNNLISNALDALESEPKKLLVRCRRSTNYPSGTKGVRFLFSDNGSGIPDDVLPRIFEAFFSTKSLKGSGIGLWLSCEVLGKYQGHIRVRTRTAGPYRGTLFDVFLPTPSQPLHEH